ncbi:hypothetical protein HDV64DRAFT_193282 [Trichoderma sp. TUCIM 5745]
MWSHALPCNLFFISLFLPSQSYYAANTNFIQTSSGYQGKKLFSPPKWGKGKSASLFGCPLCVVSELVAFLFNASIVFQKQHT